QLPDSLRRVAGRAGGHVRKRTRSQRTAGRERQAGLANSSGRSPLPSSTGLTATFTKHSRAIRSGAVCVDRRSYLTLSGVRHRSPRGLVAVITLVPIAFFARRIATQPPDGMSRGRAVF